MDDLRVPISGPPPFIKREPEKNPKFTTFAIQLAAAMRLPILAPALTLQKSSFMGFEKGNKVKVTVSALNENISRALIDDGHILAYVATQALRVFDKQLVYLGCDVIDPEKMLQEMRLPSGPDDIRKTIDGMRRLHLTKVTVENWGPARMTVSERLLSVELLDGKYYTQMPDWMDDEITAFYPRVARIPLEALAYRGARAVLFGWAKGFVGRKVGDARLISKGEAVMRAGPFGEGAEPWDELTKAVIANDIPRFDFSLTTDGGWPAIMVQRAAQPSFDQPSTTDADYDECLRIDL